MAPQRGVPRAYAKKNAGSLAMTGITLDVGGWMHNRKRVDNARATLRAEIAEMNSEKLKLETAKAKRLLKEEIESLKVDLRDNVETAQFQAVACKVAGFVSEAQAELVSRLKAEVEVLVTQKTQLRGDVDDLQKQDEALRNSMNVYQQRADEAKAFDESRARKQALHDQIAQKLKVVEAKYDKQSGLYKEQQDRDQALTACVHQKVKQEASLQEDLKALLLKNKLEAEVQRILHARKEKMREEMTQLESSKFELVMQEKNLIKEVDQAKADKAELEAEKETLGNNIDQLKTKSNVLAAEEQGLITTVDQVNSELLTLNAQKTKLGVEKQDLANEIRRQRTENEQLNCEEAGLVKAIDQAKSDLTALDAEKTKLGGEKQDLANEIRRLQTKTEQLNCEEAGLVKAIDQAKSENATVENRSIQLESQHCSLAKNVQRLNDESDDLERTKASMHAEAEQLKVRVGLLRGERSKLELEISQNQTAHDLLMKENKALVSELEHNRQQDTHLGASITKQRSEYDQLVRESGTLVQLQRKSADLQIQHQKMSQKSQTQMAVGHILRWRLARANVALSTLKASLSTKRASISQMNQSQQGLHVKVRTTLVQRNTAVGMMFLVVIWGARLLSRKQVHILQLEKASNLLDGMHVMSMSRLHRHQYMLRSYREKVSADNAAFVSQIREGRQETARGARRNAVLAYKNQTIRKATRRRAARNRSLGLQQLASAEAKDEGIRREMQELQAQEALITQQRDSLVLAFAGIFLQRTDTHRTLNRAKGLLVQMEANMITMSAQNDSLVNQRNSLAIGLMDAIRLNHGMHKVLTYRRGQVFFQSQRIVSAASQRNSLAIGLVYMVRRNHEMNSALSYRRGLATSQARELDSAAGQRNSLAIGLVYMVRRNHEINSALSYRRGLATSQARELDSAAGQRNSLAIGLVYIIRRNHETNSALSYRRGLVTTQVREIASAVGQIKTWRKSYRLLAADLDEARGVVQVRDDAIRNLDDTIHRLNGRVYNLTDKVTGADIVARAQSDHIHFLRSGAKTAAENAQASHDKLVQSHAEDLKSQQDRHLSVQEEQDRIVDRILFIGSRVAPDIKMFKLLLASVLSSTSAYSARMIKQLKTEHEAVSTQRDAAMVDLTSKYNEQKLAGEQHQALVESLTQEAHEAQQLIVVLQERQAGYIHAARKMKQMIDTERQGTNRTQQLIVVLDKQGDACLRAARGMLQVRQSQGGEIEEAQRFITLLQDQVADCIQRLQQQMPKVAKRIVELKETVLELDSQGDALLAWVRNHG